ncbi:vWA domain-containing protein [Actinacidiphila sp. ITFR-21]|uniref:vWA domain-containing protein n=1 Tax=Actinacidiphila sp. ITFR-21 TaxID=3075199 RepID=UPI00288BFB74|nr:VWA domain-containing protein [Streptomyces sp. ITFR-21]WNI16104.1 VWA domain-containing protein [Streptomyces sp. ITFR-21]
MSTFSDVERPAVFPVCLVLDVSYSMQGPPLTAVNAALREIKQVILDDPATGEIARLAVVTFSDRAEVVLPLTDLQYANPPQLAPQGGTNFAEGLRVARQCLREGISGLGKGARYHRPVVFFVSDGEHNAQDDWTVPFKELTARADKYGAEVVSFGFGQANQRVIKEVSTRFSFFAKDTDPAAAVREILKTVLMSIRTTSGSFASATGGMLSVPHNSAALTPLPLPELEV